MIARYTLTPVISLKTDGGVIGNVTFSINVGLNDDYSITMFDSAPIAATYDGSTPQSPTGDTTPRHVGDAGSTHRGARRHHDGASLSDHSRHQRGAHLSDHGRASHAATSEAFKKKSPELIAKLGKDLGLKPHQAAGLVGGLGEESGGFQEMQEKNPRSGRGGLGWGQWTGPRRRQFEAYAASKGLSTSSDEANYGFLKHELQTSESGALAALKKTGTLEEATHVAMKQYERPGVEAESTRLNYAHKAMDAYNNTSSTGATPSSSTPGDAAGLAEQMDGLKDHDPRGHALLKQYLSKDASRLDPADTDWCARFVAQSVKGAGGHVPPGSDTATSWANYGRPLKPGETPQRGDVFVDTRGHAPGVRGGHVGIITGDAMAGGEYPTIEGDKRVVHSDPGAGHMATVDSVNPKNENVVIRRPIEEK